ncbi:hypothetical protein LQ384_23535 [Rhodococcus rhodochrous]|uniref:Uncharacterized protein n=1 Tax=Rhodococcus rhodochrous TaxID=1829 RepID=A0AAW4XNV2_RHORH|nr:hypothetical protein [Rhodococcus rhodochrous]MCD2114092.1 hypothetical protein [Rhodococcus rhodochrous]
MSTELLDLLSNAPHPMVLVCLMLVGLMYGLRYVVVVIFLCAACFYALSEDAARAERARSLAAMLLAERAFPFRLGRGEDR